MLIHSEFTLKKITIVVQNMNGRIPILIPTSPPLILISEGSSDELTVFRFHYKGAMKNRREMAAWTETFIRDCGVECTGVLFETGGRGKDKYD